MATKTKTSSKKKANNSSMWSLSRLSHSPTALIAVLFVLIFGAVGTDYVVNSHASTSSCVYNTYSTQLQNKYVGCVQELQYVLDNWRAAPKDGGIGPYLNQDGYYGPITQTQVKFFQEWVGISHDGVAGYNTWYWLCDAASYTHFKYDSVGCVTRWPNMMAHPTRPN